MEENGLDPDCSEAQLRFADRKGRTGDLSHKKIPFKDLTPLKGTESRDDTRIASPPFLLYVFSLFIFILILRL